MKNQVEFIVQLVGTTRWTTTNTCKPQLAELGFHVLTRRQASFGPGFMSWHGGKLPYPRTFAFGFLLSAMPFYFLQCFAAFCFGPGSMSWHGGKLPYPCTFAFVLLLSAMPFYFLQCFAAFCKGFLIFLKGFSIFLDGFPLPKKSKKIHLRQQVYKRLLFELCNSLPLCSPSFIIATRSPSIIIATMPTSHPTKAIRMSRCKFGGINISPANFTPMKKYFSHVIIAILLLFLHKYHGFALSPSSLIHIVVLKISRCNISWSKESRYRKQIAMTSDCYAQWSIEYLMGKEWKKEAGEYKQWT